MTQLPTEDPTVDTSDVTLAIGEAASAAGVNPGTLRRWEQEGLISPARSKGGHRLYQPSDVERARRIKRLRADGLNAAAIARELGPTIANDAPEETESSGLGHKLRVLRQRRGLTPERGGGRRRGVALVSERSRAGPHWGFDGEPLQHR